MNLEEIFIEERLTAYLLLLRITPNLKGYRYIKEGVKKILKDPSKKFNVKKRLYAELGEDFSKREELVDRSMRHAIDVCFKKKGISEFERETKIYFSDDKPATREVLSLLTEIIKFDCEKLKRDEKGYLDQWIELE